MTQPQLSPNEIDRHDAHFRRGCELIDGKVLIQGKPSHRLGWFGKRRLREAVRHFQAALEINSGNWPAMWNLGKIYQRFGDHREALAWFKRSHEIKPDQ